MMSRLLPIFKYRCNETLNIHWSDSCNMQILIKVYKFLKNIYNFCSYKEWKDMKCRLQISSKYCCNENLDTSRWVDYFLLSSNVVMKFLIFMKDV